jgi:O-antigen ligase
MTVKKQTLGVERLLWVLPLALLSGTLVLLALQGREMIGLGAILALIATAVIFIRPAIGILVFLASFFVTYGGIIPTQGRFTPNNVLGLFFLVLTIARAYQERNLDFLKDRTLQVFTLIVAFFHLSSHILERQLGNPLPQLDLTGRMLHELTTRFIFLVFFVNFIRTLRDVKLVLYLLLGIIIVTGLSGVANALTGGGFGIGGYRAAADVGISAAGNANRLAFYCVLGIALSWYYKQVVRSRVLNLFLTGAIPGLAIAALMTASRSGLLNLFVVFGLLAMEGRFSIVKQVRLILVVGVIVFFASDFLSDTHMERLWNIPLLSSSGGKGASSTGKRLNTIIDGSKIVIDRPIFGTGIGNFRWVRLQRFGAAGPPHNSYLWAVTEGGVPTLGLYLLLFWLAFKKVLHVESHSNNREVSLIARGVRTGLLSFLFFSLFADFWLNIMTYVLVGLAIVLGRLRDEELPVDFAERPGLVYGSPAAVARPRSSYGSAFGRGV